ncbi:cytochrome P450, partial [Exidia glandulosa HHB12029]
PPGPPPSLLLGNVSDVPTSKEAEGFAKLGAKYGPLVHLRLLHKHMIIINSLDVAEDLLERRGAIYSDRPPFTMLGDLMGWNWAPTFMPYGPLWRAHRRVFQSRIGTTSLSPHLRAVQQYANVKLLQGLLETPEDFMQHTHCSAAAGLLMMSFGIDIEKDNSLLKLNEAGVDSIVEAGVPGRYAVDAWSALKHVPIWMPGAGFKRQARAWRDLATRVLEEPFAHTRSAMASTTSPSLKSSRDPQERHLQECNLLSLSSARSPYIVAGVDTVKSYVNAGILALVLDQEIQRRMHAEIVGAIGSDKLPTAEDREVLPLVEAFVREVYRFYPPVPLGIPHSLMQDDVYKGYLIPMGSTIVANIWAMLRDPAVYSEPHLFNPNRFLTDGGHLSTTVPDPRTAVFGFGRRTCPGRLYGDEALWLALATIVACFTVEPSHN